MKQEKLDPTRPILMPAVEIPSFRTSLAIQRGAHKNLLLKTWGGLGDQICAEPTLRFAINTFKDCDISLASERPELFRHLNFKEVFDLKKVAPIYENYLTFDTIRPPNTLTWEFMSHMLTNCVDFPSLCAFRCTLPVAAKEVILKPNAKEFSKALDLLNSVHTSGNKSVAIHAGKHWQSKTFPKPWWDAVIKYLLDYGAHPILIGANTDDNRGTVDVETPKGVIDFRNKLSVMESVALLQLVKVVLTNDSSPLHMAASGPAWIGYVATCKHPDYISHWRNGKWAWRMKNMGLSGIWDEIDYCPNKENELTAENVGDRLEAWLPDPVDFAGWAIDKIRKGDDGKDIF